MSDAVPPEDFEDLFENAPCGYLVVGRDGRITRANATLLSMLGRQSDAVVGSRFRDLLNVAGAIFYETNFAPLLRMQGYFHEVALDLVLPGGGELPVLVNATERRDELGKPLGTRIALFPATKRRRHERGLAAGMAQHEAFRLEEHRASELREQFIAVLGHDLRNPLAGLEGGRRLLERMHDDPKSARIFRLMGESVGRMSGLIDNLMDFARGRLGGGISVELVEGRIEPTIAQVVNEIRAAHPDRKIELHLDLSQRVSVDQARIAQMFSNLLGNAVTHGAADEPIEIGASLIDGEFLLTVANGGEPISSEAMQRLFQPFYRGEVRPSAQGLGLGLYIASQIAEAHGGNIEVTSDNDQTRFTFRMPA